MDMKNQNEIEITISVTSAVSLHKIVVIMEFDLKQKGTLAGEKPHILNLA